MTVAVPRSYVYGVMAEFENANALVAAARQAHEAGYRQMDGYTPYPIEELHEALQIHDTTLTRLVLGSGVAGCIGRCAIQYWMAVGGYPLIGAGRPLHSWPAFI